MVKTQDLDLKYLENYIYKIYKHNFVNIIWLKGKKWGSKSFEKLVLTTVIPTKTLIQVQKVDMEKYIKFALDEGPTDCKMIR